MSTKLNALPLEVVAERSRVLTTRLADAGLQPGTRVFLVVGDPVDDFIVLVAASRLELPVFLSPPGTAPAECARMLERSGAQAVLATKPRIDLAQSVSALFAPPMLIEVDAEDQTVRPMPHHQALGAVVGGEDIGPLTQYVTFTSGTTGQPKGIQHSADTMAYAGRWAVNYADPLPGAILAVISLAHAAGMAFSIFAALESARDLVFWTGKWDPDEALKLAESRNASFALCIPTHLADLVGARTRSPEAELALTVAAGGAPVHPDLVEEADRLGIKVCRIFGLSECLGHTSTSRTDPVDLRKRSEGFSYPGTDDVCLAIDGTVQSRGTGEAACRGPSLFLGYLGAESLAECLTPDGFFRTGDYIEIDDEGRLRVIGRLKDIIIRGGENIDPVEIEQLLVTAPGVEHAAVLGYQDERLGERVGAVVAAQGDVTGQTLEEHLLACGLAKFKVPDRWVVLDSLPRGATGKIDRRQLRDVLGQGGASGS